jgi:hypothetical protein
VLTAQWAIGVILMLSAFALLRRLASILVPDVGTWFLSYAWAVAALNVPGPVLALVGHEGRHRLPPELSRCHRHGPHGCAAHACSSWCGFRSRQTQTRRRDSERNGVRAVQALRERKFELASALVRSWRR